MADGIKVKAPGVEIAVSDESLERTGNWLSRVLGAPIEESTGMLTDWLKVKRATNRVLLVEQARAKLAARGITEPTKLLPIKVAIPLIESASNEDEPTLRSMWSSLLANAVDAGFPFDVTPSFVDVLRSLSPYEVQIVQTVYSTAPRPEPAVGTSFLTEGLPQRALPLPREDPVDDPQSPTDPKLRLALSNLNRLGMLVGGTAWGGGQHFGTITTTSFGAAFFQACSED